MPSLLLSCLPLNTSVTTEQSSSSDLNSCLTMRSRGSLASLSTFEISFKNRYNSNDRFCFFKIWWRVRLPLLFISSLALAESTILCLKYSNTLQGKSSLQAGKEMDVYVWREARIIVLKLLWENQGLKVSVLCLEQNRKRCESGFLSHASRTVLIICRGKN